MTKKKTSSSSPLDSFLDDCARPSCDDMVSMIKQAQDRQSTAIHRSESIPAPSTGTSLSSNNETVVQCPPNSAELGRGSWTLLHSMAAWYPDKPSLQDEQHMFQFMAALGRFYPCLWCAQGFQANLDQNPVPTSSRTALCQWLCEYHNVVNKKLGKPSYSCDMKTLDERWRVNPRKECRDKGHST